jgi:hypothetical protein
VILSVQRYEEIMARENLQGPNPDVGRKFYVEHKDWVDMQNALVDQHGIPGEEYRPW